MNKNPNDPTSSDAPWEEAMSRDFDARVRDLHEAPLDFNSVKGKARTIRRNRRAAVAGGILGVAAIVTPIAVLTNGGDTTNGKEPDFAPQTTESATPMTGDVDYIVDGVWHRADGGKVTLPDQANAYDVAVIWNDQLVASHWDGEVFSVTDVIDADGRVVYTFDSAGDVAVNEAGTTIAWIDPEGTVMTAWDGDEASIGSLDMSAPGESIAWSVAAVTGGPDCNEGADGCTVYVNSNLGEQSTAFSSHGINESPVPSPVQFFDATESGLVSYQDGVGEFQESCGGVYSLDQGDFLWPRTCEYQTQAFSPDGNYVAAPPSQYDGNGPTSISILNAATGKDAGTFTPEGGFVGSWSWTADGRLLFDTYDGANWHLMALQPDGALSEIGEPVKADEFNSPFVIIQR